ncbi:hypothetical protein C8R46DRAFT_1082621 [Mycena filopes]|nr:hypothetical protein C8R46DRAFT_1082621 [Mycena filopes]
MTSLPKASQTLLPLRFPNISPPELAQSQSHGNTTTNQNTRPPKHYDMHLHPDLILEHVEWLPFGKDIREILCSAVDAALSSRTGHPPGIFPTQTKISGWQRARTVANEAMVASFYARTTAAIAMQVASGLALSKDGEDWQTLFTFSNTSPKGDSHGGAISDGFLSIDLTHIDEARSDSSPAGQRLIDTLLDEDLSDRTLAVWEFKSINVGGRPMMLEIARIAGMDRRFHWTSCGSKEACTNKQQHYVPDRKEARVTGHRMGFDADLIPLKPTPATGEAQRSEPKSEGPGDLAPLETDSSLYDPSHSDVHGLNARHILQQVWAQAVKHDTTFLVIHSGNWEYIGVRHRSSQTLYLSELFSPSADCGPCGGYAKLHTGLYLMAIQDAQKRALMMQNALAATPSTAPDSWTRNYSYPRAKRPRKSGAPIVEANPCNYEDIIDIFGTQDELSIKSDKYPIFSIADMGRAITFTKCTNANPHAPFSRHPDLLFTAKERHGNCWVGELSGLVIDPAQPDLPTQQLVVVKIATTSEQQSKLRNEFAVYSKLAARAIPPLGILRPVYLFEASHNGETHLALVMPFAGVPYDPKKQTTQVKKVAESTFQVILQDLHAAGYLYPEIDQGNILINDDLRLTLVGLDLTGPAEGDVADIHKWDRNVARDRAMLAQLLV